MAARENNRSMMRRTVVVLSWILVVLVVSERLLSWVERNERQSESRLRRLIPAAVLQGREIAAIRVENTTRGEAVLLVRTSSGWRGLSHWGAPADEARLQNALRGLLEAQGIARPGTHERMVAYGLGPSQVLRVSFHGPRVLKARDHDLVGVIEIGGRLPGGRGTYARLGGASEVIAVDEDLRQDLVSADDPGAIPLIDPRIVPASWSAGARIERIEVRPERAPPFELRMRARNVKREEIISGVLPWEWVLVKARSGRVAPWGPANAFVAFLQQATYRAPIDPRPRRGLGLEPPRARVVLHPGNGPALELQIGGSTPGGTVVKNALTQSVFVVEPSVAALLVPRAESLRGKGANAWDARLRASAAVPETIPTAMPPNRRRTVP